MAEGDVANRLPVDVLIGVPVGVPVGRQSTTDTDSWLIVHEGEATGRDRRSFWRRRHHSGKEHKHFCEKCGQCKVEAGPAAQPRSSCISFLLLRALGLKRDDFSLRVPAPSERRDRAQRQSVEELSLIHI